MESKTMKFKTNINCQGCVSGVKPHLDAADGISQWSVDTSNADKILSVESENMTPQEIENLVKKAGFQAEFLS